ncbi:MAG: non-canonical purine NTP pyrophosphatase, partial [Bacteroidota bacterium]|nr:non-canonical purine NTP pyrophosphatase [Bacteroidota bacterium]
MIEIVFATNNLNKLIEVRTQLPKQIKLVSLKDIGCKQDLPETQTT